MAQVVPDLRRKPDSGAPDSLLLLWRSRTRTFSREETDPTGMLLQRPAETFPRRRVVFAVGCYLCASTATTGGPRVPRTSPQHCCMRPAVADGQDRLH